MRILLLFICSIAWAQFPEVLITPKAAATTGDLCFEDVSGDRICLRSATAVTPYNLTLPSSLTPGCLSVDGAGVLTWAACVALPINDSSILLRDQADATKQGRFELGGLTTGTTRVLTFQNADYTIAGTNFPNLFSSIQTFGANILFDAANARDVGSSTAWASNIHVRQLNVRDNSACAAAGISVTISGLVYAQNSSCITTARMDGSGVQVEAGGTYRVSGTTVIDASRRLFLDGSIPNVGSSLTPTLTNLRLGSLTNNWLEATAFDINGNNILPFPAFQSTSRVGSVSLPFNQGHFQNLTVTGTCTGCAGTIPDATQFTAGKVNTTTQSFGGDKSFFGSVLPGVAGVYNSGSDALPWINMVSRKVSVNYFGSSHYLEGVGVNNLVLSNPGGQLLQQWFSATGAASAYMVMGGSLLPNLSNYDVGGAFTRWNTFYGTSLNLSPFGNITAYVGFGNFYNRTFAGVPFCAGVTDGWTGIDTLNKRTYHCIGGQAWYAQLTL